MRRSTIFQVILLFFYCFQTCSHAKCNYQLRHPSVCPTACIQPTPNFVTFHIWDFQTHSDFGLIQINIPEFVSESSRKFIDHISQDSLGFARDQNKVSPENKSRSLPVNWPARRKKKGISVVHYHATKMHGVTTIFSNAR